MLVQAGTRLLHNLKQELDSSRQCLDDDLGEGRVTSAEGGGGEGAATLSMQSKTSCSTSTTDKTFHFDDDSLKIMEIRKGSNFQGEKRLIEIEGKKASEQHLYKLQQKIFLAELDQMSCPLKVSLDHLGQSFSCSNCDERMAHLKRVPIQANLELRENINFMPPDAFNDGHFVFNLLKTGFFDHLPAERMRDDAHCRTIKLISKINIHNAAIAQLASLKLQQLFSRNGASWATPFDLKRRHLVLPLHCVVRPTSDSSPARVCIAPNVQYHTTLGTISYNSALHSVSSTQPRFYRFLLQHQHSLTFATADVSNQFNSLVYTYDSTLDNITFAMKSRKGLPTYVIADCDDHTLYEVRNKVVGFGNSLAPPAVQYCMRNATQKYRQYHTIKDTFEKFLIDICEHTLQQDAWADDLFIYVGMALILKYIKIKKITMTTCEMGGGELRMKGGISPEGDPIQEALAELTHLANELLFSICVTLTKILQYGGFKLKLFTTKDATLQKKLNTVIEQQNVGCDNPDFIEVRKPTKKALHEQLQRLYPNADLPNFTTSSSPSSGISHLGLIYDNRQVSLMKQSLSFYYSKKGKKVKSREFFSFRDFLEWRQNNHPTFSRRSLFSFLSCNQDISGRHLALYRARIKILIRNFLKRCPNSSWETPINDSEEDRLLKHIELYFHLVQTTIKEPTLAKFATSRAIIGLSDGGHELYSCSLTLVYSYTVNGVTRREATNLCILPYSTHLEMINIVSIELTGFMKLLIELGGYLLELKSLGIEFPPEKIILGSDSMILINLLRSKVTHLQKNSSHRVAKIVIQLHSLNLDQWKNLKWVSQKLINFIPDFVSKADKNESIAKILKTREKMFDFRWITDYPLHEIPGLSTQLPQPSQEDLENLKQRHVLSSEWAEFCKNLESEKTQKNYEKLRSSSAAAAAKIPVFTRCCEIQSPRFKDVIDTPGTNTICTAVEEEDPPCKPVFTEDWISTITQLIQRKQSFGFTHKGCVRILALCLKFFLKLKSFSKLPSKDRSKRQMERREAYRSRCDQNAIPTKGDKNLFRTGHNLLVKSVDLFTLDWGNLDVHLGVIQPQGPEGPGGQRAEDLQPQRPEGPRGQEAEDLQLTDENLDSRIFHLLSILFQDTTPIKHFRKLYIQDHYGNQNYLLIGRRQRNIFENQQIEELRLRPVRPDSPLATLILTAAHAASFDNLIKAKLSIIHLNVFIQKTEERLRRLGNDCPSCNLVRAMRGRMDNLVKNDRRGPSSQLYRILKWNQSTTYHLADLAGPCHTYLGHTQQTAKFYVLLFLQLPLKQLHLVAVKDYSSSALQLGFLEYQAKVGGKISLLTTDAGSNFSVFHNNTLGFQDRSEEEMPPRQRLWFDLLMGRKGSQLKDAGIHLKLTSQQHKSANQVESAVSSLKKTLAAINKKVGSTLDVFEWNYIFRMVEKSILTRPLGISATGRIYTAQCLLSLLGQTLEQNEDLLIPEPEAKSDVAIENLSQLEERLKRLRKEIGFILADCLLNNSIFEDIVREEKVKIRKRASEVATGDVFFCPKIFQTHFNSSQSLIKLIRMGDAKTSGVFTKTGKPGVSKYLTRDFSDIYFICEGNRDYVFENDWKPSFRLGAIFKENLSENEHMQFDPNPQQEEIEECLKKQKEVENNYDEYIGSQHLSVGQREPEEGQERPWTGKTPQVDADERVTRTRYGRTVKKTNFYGVDPKISEWEEL